MQEVQQAKVFFNNRTQAVRMPATARFDGSIEKVSVRVVGQDRILSPVENTWDSFFMTTDGVSNDFMNERASQEQPERESF
ncbi:MAG: type II toxin-antitoxin system VapB family antitoxin [Colwellia sp.]